MGKNLKSTWEIAMEKAKEMGGKNDLSLSPNQKKEISEIRQIYSAKIAEVEILINDIELQHREIERLKRERERKIESIYQKTKKD